MNEIIYRDAQASDITVRPVDRGLSGHYEPNQPGATSLRDARALYIDGKHVTAEVSGRTVTIFVGCLILCAVELPEEITERGQINPWVAARALAGDLQETFPVGTDVTVQVFGRWVEGKVATPQDEQSVMVTVSFFGGNQVKITDPDHLRKR